VAELGAVYAICISDVDCSRYCMALASRFSDDETLEELLEGGAAAAAAVVDDGDGDDEGGVASWEAVSTKAR